MRAQVVIEPHRLSVLRAAVEGVESERISAVDVALHDALVRRREFSIVQSLPVPLEDVQLATGCGADENVCIKLMAAQLDGGALMVRRLTGNSDGTMTLALLVHDATFRQDEPWGTQAAIVGNAPQDVALLVQGLLDQMFPQSVGLASASHDGSAPAGGSGLFDGLDRRWQIGVGLSAVGGTLLIAGLTSALLSRHDENKYAHADIAHPEDVDRAQEVLARSERRARIANTFFGVGAALTAVGVGSLLWRWTLLRRDAASTTVNVQPVAAGALLTIDGSWRGGT